MQVGFDDILATEKVIEQVTTLHQSAVSNDYSDEMIEWLEELYDMLVQLHLAQMIRFQQQ